jgi:hypothetical protein
VQKTEFGALLAVEELDLAQTLHRFVTGHDFSRAAEGSKMVGL